MKTIVLTRKKDCVNSIVYTANSYEEEPIVTSLYLMRTFAKEMPQKIQVTVEGVKE